MRSATIMGVAMVCILVTACASMKAQNQISQLDTSLKQYGAALRWGRINQAYNYHINRDGKQPDFDLEKMENFSITDFKPASPAMNEDATEATVPVEIDYYNEQYGTLKKIKYVQQWWYKEEARHWFIESEFPDFK